MSAWSAWSSPVFESCGVGFYLPPEILEQDRVCTGCVRGAWCYQNGTIVAKTGWWRVPPINKSASAVTTATATATVMATTAGGGAKAEGERGAGVDAHVRPYFEPCLNISSTPWCEGFPTATEGCAEGHMGVLCAVCKPGFSRWRATSACYECPKDIGEMAGSIAQTVAILVTMFACFLLFLRFNRGAPNMVMRPIINFGQMATVILM